MLFFVRIPGLVYFELSFFTCVAIFACVSKMIGFGYFYFLSEWLQFVIMILGSIILTLCVKFFVSRQSEKWNEMGLRYAKYATADGMKNHAEKAAQCFLKAAICKNVDSVINLGLCYAEGFGVERNLEKAVKCYRIAAKESTIAVIALAICYAEGVYVEKDMVKSEDLLKCVWLTSALKSWCECYWNPAEVRTWIHKAAELGSAEQQCRLGSDYEHCVEDEAEAVKWYRKAAERGYLDAQLSLGRIYDYGKGVVKDEAEAIKWYRKAAEQGNASAQDEIGNHYLNGKGVEKDEIEAVKWFRKAAEQDDAYGQVSLGQCYLCGRGVEKDEAEAVKLFREAAEQGDASAQTFLADCYLFGRGVAKDETEALTWFRRAAKQDDYGAETAKNYLKAVEDDDPEAQCDLAIAYRYGQGCAKNEVEAVKWFRKAAEQGFKDAQNEIERIERLVKVSSEARGAE